MIASYDSIGNMTDSSPIATSGTAGDMLMGCAESFYKKDMSPEDIEENIAQVLTSGVDRDASSGWGGLVYVLTEKSLKIKRLKVKMT